MIANAKLMCCGNCGNRLFAVHQIGGSNTFPDALVTECKECQSTTLIAMLRPRMELRFAEEKSEGILCCVNES